MFFFLFLFSECRFALMSTSLKTRVRKLIMFRILANFTTHYTSIIYDLNFFFFLGILSVNQANFVEADDESNEMKIIYVKMELQYIIIMH